jgi:hypothetical protein
MRVVFAQLLSENACGLADVFVSTLCLDADARNSSTVKYK